MDKKVKEYEQAFEKLSDEIAEIENRWGELTDARVSKARVQAEKIRELLNQADRMLEEARQNGGEEQGKMLAALAELEETIHEQLWELNRLINK